MRGDQTILIGSAFALVAIGCYILFTRAAGVS